MTPEQLGNVYLKAASKADPFADDAVLVGLAAVGEAIAAELNAEYERVNDSPSNDPYYAHLADGIDTSIGVIRKITGAS